MAFVGPLIGAIIGVFLYEGYLILMKKYANLPGIVHVDAIEQHIHKEDEKTHHINTQLSTESKSFFEIISILSNIFLLFSATLST